MKKSEWMKYIQKKCGDEYKDFILLYFDKIKILMKSKVFYNK
jgi:hypothetical protein